MLRSLDRRRLLIGVAAAAVAGEVKAQTSAAQSANQDYARIYSAGSKVDTPTLNGFLAAQEARAKTAVNLTEFKVLLDRNAMVRALEVQRNNQKAAGAKASGAVNEAVALGQLLLWNDATMEMTSLDHTSLDPTNPPPTYGEQFGPARTSRAVAIYSLAVFEAVNTIFPKYRSYRGLQAKILKGAGVDASAISPDKASTAQAIASAAYDSLVALYPRKKAFLDAVREKSGVLNGDSAPAKALGKAIGEQAAKLVLAERSYQPKTGKFLDGSQNADPPIAIFDQDDIGLWRQDPISQLKPALGALWHQVQPFVIKSATDALPPPPPAYDSPEFATAYRRVKTLGGDPEAKTLPPRWPTPTTRTGTKLGDPLDRTNQTFVGIYWGYDGTALLCAPLRLYNMIAISIAMKELPINTVADFARYLALINVALGDAGVAAWTAKYHYMAPRPVTYLRGADVDMTPEGKADPNWTPLGAPVTNGGFVGRNLTPPFPAYPSGHATFGGALFEMIALYYQKAKTDPSTAFTFVSDEYNGVNRGPDDASPRPRVELKFPDIASAQKDNADSRIYIGVHWDFDATEGVAQGEKIAKAVYAGAFQPI